MIYLDVFVFIIFITLFRFFLQFTVTIRSLTDFICLDISLLLAFSIFCLSDFINICKSKVDNTTNFNLALHQNYVSLPDSPDRRRLSFQFHA